MFSKFALRMSYYGPSAGPECTQKLACLPVPLRPLTRPKRRFLLRRKSHLKGYFSSSPEFVSDSFSFPCKMKSSPSSFVVDSRVGLESLPGSLIGFRQRRSVSPLLLHPQIRSSETLELQSAENKIKLCREYFRKFRNTYFVYIVIIQMWKVLKLVKFPQIVRT